MAKGSNRKKQRTSRKSAGVHGSTHHPLNEVEKALLGKGLVESLEPVPMKSPWRGAQSFDHPYDARQAAENRLLYPHLFGDF